MKIVLDMQSRQTPGSRDRGIGRYSLSLAKAMLDAGRQHDFIILATQSIGNFEKVAEDFGLAPGASELKVFSGMRGTRADDPRNSWRRKASQYIREDFLNGLNIDCVHASSVFEGFDSDGCTSISYGHCNFMQATTLYDLIPFSHPEIYLREPVVANWYYERLGHVRRSDLLLAISQFSADDAVARLSLEPFRVRNISGAADEHFVPVAFDGDERARLLGRYGLAQFIMYTGGIDHRKNIDGLIRAYAKLPRGLSERYQLAIVCKAELPEREWLLEIARREGIADGRVVFTGYVPESDLLGLYNLCSLFVFPSWYEGLGLPALEAMQCGAPVIAANASSLIEIVGRQDALFDPHDAADTAAKMVHALTDDDFREDLIRHGLEQARSFTWKNSAHLALDAMEERHAQWRHSRADRTSLALSSTMSARPRLAFVSPLPPERSGIAVYSTDLLPHLAEHYRITLINSDGETTNPYLYANMPVRSVDWFRENAASFDRVIYQFGNSSFHSHMFDLLEDIPGAVVLHDFWLSGIVAHMDLTGIRPGMWNEALHYGHGWSALQYRWAEGDEKTRLPFSVNQRVVRAATGVIVHSERSQQLLAEEHGKAIATATEFIQLVRVVPAEVDKAKAIRELGYPENTRLLCSFGFIDGSKRSIDIAEAFLASGLARDPTVRLVFVGDNPPTEYGREMQDCVAKSGGKIRFTGFVDDADYQRYLRAAEAAVQLRAGSRGETSGAALDCLAHRVALLINDNPAFSEIPRGAAICMDGLPTGKQLASGLETLMAAGSERAARIAVGLKYLTEHCAPSMIADDYARAIERFNAQSTRLRVMRTCAEIASLDDDVLPGEEDLLSAAAVIRRNSVVGYDDPCLYLDAALARKLGAEVVQTMQLARAVGKRMVELLDYDGDRILNAKGQMADLLQLPDTWFVDEAFDPAPGSACVIDLGGIQTRFDDAELVTRLFDKLDTPDLEVWFLCPDDYLQRRRMDFLVAATRVANGFIVTSNAVAGPLQRLLGMASAMAGKSEVMVRGLGCADGQPRAEDVGAENAATPGETTQDESTPAKLVDVLGDPGGDHQGVESVAIRPNSTTRGWRAGDPRLASQVGVQQDGMLVASGSAGFLVFGPYATLPAGRCRLHLYGNVDAADAADAWYDVTAMKGDKSLVQPTAFSSAREGFLAEQEFDLDVDVDDLEVRIWVAGDVKAKFFALALEQG